MAKGSKNLVPQNQRTKEEQREVARKGGLASGIARRKKRNFREIFQALRDEKMPMKFPDGRVEQLPFDVASAMAMYRKAASGDTKAMKLIAEIMGEYEYKISLDGGPAIVPMTPDAIEALSKWAAKE